jgi:hypothetical protein
MGYDPLLGRRKPDGISFVLNCWRLLGKGCAEHRQPARRHLARNFVLDNIPVFSETPVLDARDVDYDPICGLKTEATEPAMQHQHVALSEDQAILNISARAAHS